MLGTKERILMDKLVFGHVSDIHFSGTSGSSVHDLDADVRNELLRDAAGLVRRLGSVAGALVTGDIAFSGQRAEYNRAGVWLGEFCRAIGCPEESVWLVPGNHDVDRKIAKSKLTKTLHKSIRAKHGFALDDEIREILTDDQSAEALLAPLVEYNAFAARFQCAISAAKPFWERDLYLSCGTTVRLRGICSVLVSNDEDIKGNLVLGSAQVSVQRSDGVVYVTLCHHPPDWVQDQDAVLNHLEAKVHLQLFGHKHAQRVQAINNRLRVTAGAMHPERGDLAWEPIYNVIEIERRDDEHLVVRVFQRIWHKTACCFVAAHDPDTGNEYREQLWRSPRPRIELQQPAVQQVERGAESLVARNPELGADAAGIDVEPSRGRERRLTFRFLTLPFRHQVAVANSLNLLTDDDREMANDALLRVLFARAVQQGLLRELWAETEKRHDGPDGMNPFDTPK